MRASGLFPVVQTAAPRPTKAKKEGKRKAEKSMHLINKQKRNKRKKCTTNAEKKTQREPGRAGGQRPAAWPGGNSKKYVPKTAGKTGEKPAAGRLSLLPEGTDGRVAADKTKRKAQKKEEKEGWRAKSPGLAARQGSGGREVVAASASLGAG